MKKTTVFITHDLDEAVRVGDRIAIMRDGRVVQTGTAEEIITNPADDYVAEFVAGISRLKVVRAKAIMQTVASYEKAHGQVEAGGGAVDEDENLTNIIRVAMQSDATVTVKRGGKTVGVITAKRVLQTVIEGTETS